ncbi:hypothetical protein BGZ94_009170 [Podila epigama]|nr:hypothetical protein BGZ94_009170 [Podila epigama]
MKFSALTVLISFALAVVASAAPLLETANANVNVFSNSIAKRNCAECTQSDVTALDLILKASADHYADIARIHLDGLMQDINSAKVTSGEQDLPKEKALLSAAVQAKIDAAKKACSSEELLPAIKVSVNADTNLNIPWSNKDQVDKKLADLDVKITKILLDRIQTNINAEILSKDCTEKMTNTVITPAPAGPTTVDNEPSSQGPESSNATPVSEEAPSVASPPETPTPTESTPQPVPENSDNNSKDINNSSNNNNETIQAGIHVAAPSVDPKYVCKSGCQNSKEAKLVLNLRVTLENELTPRLETFYNKEVPTACTDKRVTLLDRVLSLLANVSETSAIQANVEVDKN